MRRETNLPGWALFVVGIATILVSFNLIDRVLPEIDSTSTVSKRRSWLTHPWTMFFLGCIVATLTLSVSVALTVLVPLAVKGYVKRDEALPYIMGANITTLADTLVVAMLQKTPVAAQIVLAEAIGVTIVSVIILAFFYKPTKRTCPRARRLAHRGQPTARGASWGPCSWCRCWRWDRDSCGPPG